LAFGINRLFNTTNCQNIFAIAQFGMNGERWIMISQNGGVQFKPSDLFLGL
jgi:hypothetical protein